MNGKHVVVAGGRGGLGRGVVEVFAARGATVHVLDMPDVDATNETQVAAFYAALPECWASVQLIGGFAMAKVGDTSLADFEKQWRLNVATCFLACREAVRAMRRGGGAGGRIVNVAARPAVQPSSGMIAYATAKAGVAALTQHLAAEVLSDRILVNAVLPSVIDTPANRAAMPGADHASWPKPVELAQTIAFLASPENALTSGALVPVFGHA
ncbi:MAG TPA: SDR family NAD(P)-dependent oxidoreductase [Kofleriaceae bacterium]|jgi:NAD(P)-dependent dehydrogenase (short-subunit alcohol dehydrogenase family)